MTTLETTALWVGIIGGVLAILGTIFGWFGWIQGWIKGLRTPRDERIERLHRLEAQMPKLIGEMRQDLQDDPLAREFIIKNKGTAYWPDPNKPIFQYFFEDHDNLRNKILLLENVGFVTEITYNNVDRFLFTEHFVEAVTSDLSRKL